MVVAHNAAESLVLLLVVGGAGKVGLESAIGPFSGVGGDITGRTSKILEVGAVFSEGGGGCESSGRNELSHLI